MCVCFILFNSHYQSHSNDNKKLNKLVHPTTYVDILVINIVIVK